jgi:hypothetical protein
MISPYREKIDACADARELHVLLAKLETELSEALASPYAEEDSFRQQAHDLELLIQYGEQKMEKMLS